MSPKIAATLLIISALILCACSAQATTVSSFSITGNAISGGCCEGISLSGGPLSIDAYDPSGALQVGYLAPGTVVSYVLGIGWCGVLQGCGTYGLPVVVTFNGQTTDMLTGSVIFSSTFTAPTGEVGSQIQITVPVVMQGNVVAFQDLGFNQNSGNFVKGPQMFNMNLNGTGTMNLYIYFGNGVDVVTGVRTQFNGTATPVVPEPGSLALVGSGLFGLAAVIKMRRRFPSHNSRCC
jgi:hypothetical protein